LNEADKNKVLTLSKEHPDWSDQTIADKLHLTRSSVWRIRSTVKSAIIDTTGWTDEEIALYEEFKIYKKHETSKPWYMKIFPLRRTLADGSNYDEYGISDQMGQHNNFLNNHTPQYNVQPIGVELDGKKIKSQSAFVAKTKENGQVIFPKFFMNPLQALDYIILQDIYMHTICGSIIDILVAFTMGKGIRPVLKLNEEDKVEIKKIKSNTLQSGDRKGDGIQNTQDRDETKEEAIARVLDENKHLLDPLIAIDNSFSDPKQVDDFLDDDFNDKIEALVRNHWIFGRDMMTYEYFEDRAFTWDGKKYPNIPNVLKVIHPRDMGFVKIDQPTLKLEGVSLMFSAGIIEANDMLYLEHNSNSPIYNGKHYGYSKMQRMIDDGRSLRKLKSRDFPNVASIGYAGFSVIAFKEDSKGANKERDQNTAFVNSLTVGSPNATTLQDPEKDMHVHNINTDAKIAEMIEMAHYHAEAAAKSVGVPTSLVSKEKDPNRDTLLSILRLFRENTVKREQIKITKKIDAQWYMKNWRIIYKENNDVLKNFHVESEFIDYSIESWIDRVPAVVELSKLRRFTVEAEGELLGIPNYSSKIDTEAEALSDDMKFEDANGNKLNITKGKKPAQNKSD
jgi:hypothetical protein